MSGILLTIQIAALRIWHAKLYQLQLSYCACHHWLSGNIITRASLIQPDDLLICVSLEGKTIAVIAAAKEAKNNGVNVIDVTSKYNSDLSNILILCILLFLQLYMKKMKFLFLLYYH
ncbi:SIS domain-containing protein [Spiroplasma phoeniceum]|uniref:SIS domain-containing protein n=1 Tax=Spiroplasma phoeniceum TaxID=47835 RepID=UPI003364F595